MEALHRVSLTPVHLQSLATRNNKFSDLLSELNALVGQLAKAHKEEVEEASSGHKSEAPGLELHTPRSRPHGHSRRGRTMRSAITSTIEDLSTADTSDVPAIGLVEAPSADTNAVPEKSSAWEQDAISLVPGKVQVPGKIQIPGNNVRAIQDLDEDPSFTGEESVEVHGQGTQGTGTQATEHFCRNSKSRIVRMENPEEGAPIRKQFWLKKPWSEHPEFDNVKVASLLQTQLLKRSKKGPKGSYEMASLRQSMHTKAEMREDRSVFTQHLISHPESRGRGFWVLLCVVFIIYDLIMAPVAVCFNLEDTSLSRCIDIVASCFWSMDIVFNFITGVQTATHVEMRPRFIAEIYARSWLLFDLLLVVPEWVTLAVDSFDGDQIAILRIARWGRLMRLLRLARLMRVVRAKPVLIQLILKFHVSSVYLQVSQGWLGLCLLYLLFAHMLACAWYAMGNAIDNGWVHVNDYKSTTAARAYILSVHWCVSRLFGLTTQNRLESSGELIVDALLIYLGFILTSFCVGTVSALCITTVNSKTRNLWKHGVAFIHRHGITGEVNMRLIKVLEALHCGGAGEIAADEAALLQALPLSLQQDLLYEAREEYLVKKAFFADMALLNQRVALHISTVAVCSYFSVEREVIFAYGDACRSVLFVMTGTFWYVSNISPWEIFKSAGSRMTEAKVKVSKRGSIVIPLGCGMEARSKTLVGDAIVSEPVLWTAWEHCGSLLAAEESTALSLDAAKFAEVIVQHMGPLMHMCRYARLFVWHLNHAENLTDLIEFPELTIQNLDQKVFDGTSEDHFVFISHYKVEAGTEATLMRDSLEATLRRDQRHPANNLISPIFIDSEDLVDLARLKEHVQKSKAFVLLLTPGVLSRPWCLIEIVTAIRNNVNIVPVEVQRGLSFKYPDEDFYATLLDGQLLDDDSLDLLEHEGILLDEVEQAVRQVFQKIALPFSPHKSKTVREAELDNVLKRCNADFADRSGTAWTSDEPNGTE